MAEAQLGTEEPLAMLRVTNLGPLFVEERFVLVFPNSINCFLLYVLVISDLPDFVPKQET